MDASKNRYLIASVVRASHVLSAFKSGGEVLQLGDVVERTGLSRRICNRLLYTLHECGLLEKVGEHQYRLPAGKSRRRFRLGFNSQGHDCSFARVVAASLSAAAAQDGVEVIAADSRGAKTSLRNAEQLIREQIDLVVDFETDEAVAAEVSVKYRAKDIKVIAVDMPQPGATYFGANNYEAGLTAGRYLGRWTNRHWEGRADTILLVGMERSGWVSQSRLRGVLNGLSEVCTPDVKPRVCALEGDGQFGAALDAVRRHLRAEKGNRVLCAAANDPSALGALRAFEEAGRGNCCAVIGHNGEPEARAEMRESRSRLIGSVAFFPEEYGEQIVRLAIALLEQRTIPDACFVKHKLLTPENVDHLYPNDPLLRTF
jgi:ribose transport system substrate-binding protein